MRKLFFVSLAVFVVLSCYQPHQFELDEPFSLSYEQSMSNSDAHLRIRFNEVVSDERCPYEHHCLLPGNASVSLTLYHGSKRHTFILDTYNRHRNHIAFGYLITLTQLAPQRSLTDPPAPEDYEVTLTISEAIGDCLDNDDCDTQVMYCAKPDGDCDVQGQCTRKLNGCQVVEDPVCGCDNKTYDNACWAAAAGVNVAYKGQCKPIKCVNDEQCDVDEYCFYETCELETGVCQYRPEQGECPRYWDPVCGCDGQTYANMCNAAAKGISVDHTGECRDAHCDDGTTPVCMQMIPNCEYREILAYQNSCYACVNPATCEPWGQSPIAQ